ncbi:MAG: mechanosensitive ion channel protein [Deltaproteobacteria bacterium RBG_19FT_COMBO_46_9]|nr:MAG: mechanosensitive ion channel protein [Deltaproteobacteria bacterium RBG_19FT_COMBO_46_9]
MEKILDKIGPLFWAYGLQFIGAIIILIAGWIAAGLAKRFVKRFLVRTKTDESVISFVGHLTYFLILAFAVLAALAKFGVQTASLIAVLGAAGLAIGLALQSTLSNFAAGVLILILRPFRIGDYIEGAGVAGTVKEIELFTTVLATVDNIKILIPNGKLFGDVIKNISGYDSRRIDLVVGISYGSPIGRAVEIMGTLIKEDSRILPDPPPQIAVSELADSSVNLVFRPWVRKEDYWDVRFDLIRKIKESFDRNGIEIPFPQRVVHHVSERAIQTA